MQLLIVITILALAGAFLAFTVIRSAKKPGCGSCPGCSQKHISVSSSKLSKISCCSNKVAGNSNQSQ